MGRKRAGVRPRDIQRWIDQGYGSGEKESYKPWLRVSDVPSQGRSRRILGLKSKRVHHLLSDLEYAIFLMAEYSPLVIDIREQYPLLPYGRSQIVAANAGIRHPVYPRTTTAVVMTHDFMLTLSPKAPDRTPVAVSVKYQWDSDEKMTRTLEKLEIERRCAKELSGANWSFVTDQDFHPTVIQSLDWLHYGMTPNLAAKYGDIGPAVLSALRALDYQQRPLTQTLDDLARVNEFQGLDPWLVFKLAAWRGHLPIDLSAGLGPRQPVTELPQVELSNGA